MVTNNPPNLSYHGKGSYGSSRSSEALLHVLSSFQDPGRRRSSYLRHGILIAEGNEQTRLTHVMAVNASDSMWQRPLWCTFHGPHPFGTAHGRRKGYALTGRRNEHLETIMQPTTSHI